MVSNQMTSEHANRKQAALLGLFIADAAALGLHWLYDPARLDHLAEQHGSLAFRPVSDDAYRDAKGIFVHHLRKTGDLSQYGETARLALTAFATSEPAVAARAYQTAYQGHFGPGGAYRGYIDRPTRTTLETLGAAGDEPPLASGADDDQLPAVSTTAVASLMATPQDLSIIEAMTRITNHNNRAVEAVKTLALWLDQLITTGHSELPPSALISSDQDWANRLQEAVAWTGDTRSAAEHFGRACNLMQGFPLAIVILKQASSYEEAIETNIRVGGDSCGRAMIIGSIAGARWGLGGTDGIPLGWCLEMTEAKALWRTIQSAVR